MAKVALLGCSKYDYDLMYFKMSEGIQAMGGLESYLKAGSTVLLKVNLLMKRRPEEATTTHPLFVKVLADILVEFGVKVVIGDSPGGPFNAKALKGIYELCGYSDLVSENISLNQNFNSQTVHCGEAYLLKTLDVIDVIKTVDAVISVSKLKTHGMTKFTGAVKNMYGTIPGIKKAEYHYTLPAIEDFSNMLIDVCIHANPVLSFMDGIVGMEGAGPSGGEPRDIGVILISDSPYHLDVVACKTVGIKPESVPTIKRCIERKLLKEDFEDLQMVSEPFEDYYINDFKIPDISGVGLLNNRVPKWVDRMVGAIIKPKPVVQKSICVGCGECARCCPAKTIEMIDRLPKINMENCIRCFCCQELCPVKAIKVYRHPIGTKLIKF